MILLVPTTGGIFVSIDGEERLKPMDSHAMLVLAERIITAAREAQRLERGDGFCPEMTAVLR